MARVLISPILPPRTSSSMTRLRDWLGVCSNAFES